MSDRNVLLASVLAVAALPAAPTPVAAQDRDGDPLREALEANRHIVTLQGGRLGGPGGELLLEAGRASQFFLIGEEHGVAEIPVLTAALFTELAGSGYRHLAIETGDGLAERLERAARDPEPLDALTRFYADHWPGAPFYTLRTEAELLVAAVAAVGAAEQGGVLWGLDYDIFGDRHALGRLRALAVTDAQRQAVDAAIEVADSALERALAEKDPAHVMMFGGPAAALDALYEAFEPEPDSEADRIISLLRETRAINAHWLEGEPWRSNERRAQWNKRQLGRLWYDAWERSGDPPRVMLKFGSNHMMRGRTPTGVFDLGTVAASLAEALGRPSFHLLVVGGPGTRRAVLNPTVMEYVPAPAELAATRWAAPVVELTDPERWTLFDLRPLRAPASRGELGEMPPRVERTLFGFDAVLVLTGSTPNEALELPASAGR
ncbi:MAG: hypothetical protein GWN71_25340 [Gammaproteobacteria bacterium]|nr:hypothetical protein [Gemmatimonadota bacterium]NIR38708.1 hypothetical protein [Actinomycetota bacterium]NIU76764.1 hypothetical protein [Gammaproteobacteria bacterium]NIY10485.1 hypothetical protein [Gemmatimonadota bacterium]